jgi:type 1 glutamine amidotransferase
LILDRTDMKTHAVVGTLLVAWLLLFPGVVFAEPKAILIVDGRNNHEWAQTTPALKQDLKETGLFNVNIATAPKSNEEMKGFRPDFFRFDAVILNYTDLGDGGEWPEKTKQAFVKYVASGGGIVVFHAASSAFPQWKEYNEITGLGGWGGRDERAGPYVYFKNGKEVRDDSRGPGGHHGKRHQFQVTIRTPHHPITRGLPHEWMHARDELYDSLRGPAQNLTVLATAYSDPATGGSGRDEPVLFAVRYGKGRVFQTTLGHDLEAMQGVGFIVTFQRGTEWAATGRVTQPVPKDFPTANQVRVRP